MSKRALGKGLDALINAGNEQQAVGKEGAQRLSLEEIRPAGDQPRQYFDEERLKELAESIKHQGVIQPIVVERQEDGYVIIAGERRYRAAKMAGLSEIPAVIARYDTEKRLLISLIENLQREDLDPIEEATAYQRLMNETGLNQEELGKQIGRNRTTIANSLRLLKLPEEMQKAVRSGEITPGHARAILSLVNPADQTRLYRKIASDKISVRDAELQAERLRHGLVGNESTRPGAKRNRGGEKPRRSPEIESIQEEFIEQLGTKVSIKGNLNGGTIEIAYFSRDDLDRLYDLIAQRDQE